MSRRLPTVEDARTLALDNHSDSRGVLVVAECQTHVPFGIARVFAINSVRPGEKRGGHAHKALQQMFVCLMGSIEARLRDGQQERSIILNSPGVGLYVPPPIWADLIFKDETAVLLALCDAPYDENDYIRDFDQYKRYLAQWPEFADNSRIGGDRV